MSSVEVTAISIPELLKRLYSGEWQAPQFQRDFVWSNPQIISLVNSVLDSKPIGMATLWAQEDDSDLPLEHISVNDWISELNKSGPRPFGDNEDRPGRYYAILDGKQRSTALAIAFGGLRAQSKRFKFSGGYFLNILAEDAQDRVMFLSASDIEDKSLDTISSYVRQGLFPLEIADYNKMSKQWISYIGGIENTEHYGPEAIPSADEIERRQDVVQKAYDGLNDTKLAVYIVPKEESLGEICDIFETLNTTGTKVSTIDLIHSWVYAETLDDEVPIMLRDEIDELGKVVGAEGWASSKKRPELIGQMLASIQIALDRKHPPRSVSGKTPTEIKSIKSSDLLAISSESWRDFFEQKNFIGECLQEFQLIISDGRFNLQQCPYPGVVNIYVALRWYLKFDMPAHAQWDKNHLNQLFRAFFWRNTYSQRYDQGILARVSSDITEMKQFLSETRKDQSFSDWANGAEIWLANRERMSSMSIIHELIDTSMSDGNTKGAVRNAAVLLLKTRARKDVLDTSKDIRNIYGAMDLHHIFPKQWCKNNKTEKNSEYVASDKESSNWVDSPANLMPMHPDSNNMWRQKSPAMALGDFTVSGRDQIECLRLYFIDENAQSLLEDGRNEIGDFLENRKNLLVDENQKIVKSISFDRGVNTCVSDLDAGFRRANYMHPNGVARRV